MHLVKWIRKNMHRIMVCVIIFIMLAFVVGQFGLKFIIGLITPDAQVIATYDDGKKIESTDYIQAQNELAILRMLMADQLLMAQSNVGLTGPLLVHLLFPESQFSSEIASQMKQAAQQGQLQISQTQLDDFFQQQRERPEILWLLLKAEAKRAGCVLPNESAAQTLRFAIPQMTRNQIDAARLVSQIISRNNIAEENILRIFSDFLGVLSYADNVMNSQAVTINQVKALLGRSKERVDAEFVKFDAEQFMDEDVEVTDEQIQQQFDKYKADIMGNPTEDNPYGFGYQLPKRIQLEYMVVLLDDVKKKIEKPTPEAIEEYYSRNLAQFQTSEPSDPNNPESEKITTTRPFAEVQAMIQIALENEKTMTQANIIFNDIKDKTEAGFETLNFDESTTEQLQKAAGDFVAVGKELAQKHQVPIITGKTGWISRDTFSQEKILSTLGVRRGQQYLRLTDLAFVAVAEEPQRQRIDMPSIRVWENIGPFSGGFYSEEEGTYARVMALVRVVDIQDAEAAENIDVAYESQGVVLNPQEPGEETSFSLKENIKNDVLLIAAVKAAQNRAEELAAMVADSGWDDAIKAYNEKYAITDETEEDAANSGAIELETIKQQLRISQAETEIAKRFIRENPDSAQFIQGSLISNMLTNKFYALLPEDAETTGTIQSVLAFEPQAACYVIKEVVRQPATMKDYLDSKAQAALKLNAAESPELALVHLNPENILKRMDYQVKREQEPVDEEETPVPSDEESK